MTIQECLSGSGLVIESPLMRDVVGRVEEAAASRSGVLVSGEPGSGRGLIARVLHDCGAPAGAPFVVVDGYGLSVSEAELLLFGAPAEGRGRGVIRRARDPEVVFPGSLLHGARGGTIVFRHLEGLPSRVQARLAALLRDREYEEHPRGGVLPFVVRPIAVADPDCQVHLDEGRVRVDLHRRFAECVIVVPSLRQRREDIPGLAQFFVRRACHASGIPEKTLDAGAAALLAALPWRGNSRELRDLLDGLVPEVPEGTITLHALLEHVSLDTSGGLRPGPASTLREARTRFEREYITAVVAHHHGRIPEAARALGIQRTNLYRKLRALRLTGALPTRPS